MKIVIVGRGYPGKKYPLNGIFEYDQAKALKALGHEVIYAAVDARSIRRTRKWGYVNFIDNGISVELINVPVGKVPLWLINSIRIKCFKVLIKRIIKKYGKPDIIHTHFVHTSYMAAKADVNQDIPLIMTEHISMVNKHNLKAGIKMMGELAYNKANTLISVSGALQKKIEHNFYIKSLVIPNIVDLDVFEYSIDEKDKDKFCFISIGHLTYKKGMDVLIDAFTQTFNSMKQVKLYIYGEGKLKKSLQSKIKEHNMQNQIFLMGVVKREDIASQMKKSNCFVLASQTETFGLSYVEALASGLPVIATKCGGPEDFITQENGVFIEIDNINELSSALMHMYTNADKYNAKLISETTKKIFSPRNIANKLQQIYTDAAK